MCFNEDSFTIRYSPNILPRLRYASSGVQRLLIRESSIVDKLLITVILGDLPLRAMVIVVQIKEGGLTVVFNNDNTLGQIRGGC